MSGKNSIQVAIKVRPLFKKEKDQQFFWRVVDNSIQLLDSQTDPYYFDHIFDQDSTNQNVFDTMAKQIVHSAIQGFNGTIFAYGQTSSGKTYTMIGDDENPGVMVLTAKEIFNEIERTQDRQFLLRVGYIEIYNEKIYDLLNKKNQDLKIHETSTGIVSVNCEEVIIRSEDDLLNHLDKGSKERTVGETNMNERSSRSHAIFRIIIESRKIDRSEDDAVIQSVINLVDLAGSERADQTGARGTRLKEGGHINKSLLFLSNVIKTLSENEDNKYISYRDSKLTRILQASLGGNALTAIICTIKPNAIEETQSTLNFALRAKSIKNKPHVNEIISDATMMKRLEHEIKVLKIRLEEEQRKNESKFKVRQLEQRIKDEDLKIISCNSLHSIRNREKRRRTWCPSSTHLDASTENQQALALALPSAPSGIPHPTRLQAPKISYYNTPLITMRPNAELPPATKVVSSLPVPGNLPEDDEEFFPGELVKFEMVSPLQTPRTVSVTPKLNGSAKSILHKVEHDLMELQSFTSWEEKVDFQHEPVLTLQETIKTLTQRISELEKERLQYLQLKFEMETTNLTESQNNAKILSQHNEELEKDRVDQLQLKHEIEITTEILTETQKRCDELQVQLSKLTNSNKAADEKIAKYEAELAELKKTNEKLEMENRETLNLEFELQRHKNKSKLRENELIEALNEKDKEVNKLQKSLNALSAELLQNSKERLMQKSINESGNDDKDGEINIKCEDLQRLVEKNKKVTSEFEKLTLEYEKLQLNNLEIEKENEKNKLKIVHLEELQEKDKAEYEKLILDIQQLKDKLHNVQRDYELLSNENSTKHEECITLTKQVEEARKEMVLLEENFAKLELSWQTQQRTINDIEAQYATIQTKYEHLQSKYEQLEATRSQSLTDFNRLEKENVDLQTEIEDLKKKVHDAQQKLLESHSKYAEAAKESKTANEEYASKATNLQWENEQLKSQLLQLQTQYDDLQKEYDDLSNQLMDNLQESDYIKDENSKLKEELKKCKEKNEEVASAETEINHLKAHLEKILSEERKHLPKTPSPRRNLSMRSSGVCIEEEEDYAESPQSQELLRKFCELSESLTEIELEHTNGKTKLFKSTSKSSTPNSYKMYLKNILGVQKTQKEFDIEIENIHLQGSFKHSFHIVELSGKNSSHEIECSHIEMNGCENMAEYVDKLKHEIAELKAINEQEHLSNKSLLESTERAFVEMREQITQLSAELLEKSIFVENCACKTYQQQIENLEKEKADMTIMCEELQEKVNCTLNGSLLMNNTVQRELEEPKQREPCGLCNSQANTLEEMTKRCIGLETELEIAREQLKNQEKDCKEKLDQMQLEILDKLELSASEYRDNMKKYNKEWEDRRQEYEQTIKDLQNQIEALKQTAINVKDLKVEVKEETVLKETETEIQILEDTPETATDTDLQDELLPEDIDAIKRDKCRLEEENISLQQQLNTSEDQIEHMKEENRNQNEELILLDAKLVHLEELLVDAKALHVAISRENSSLKTEMDNIKEDLNCIPELHNRNQQLSDELEKLQHEYKQLKDKLQEVNRPQVQEFLKKDKEAKTSKKKDFQNLQQEYRHLHDNLQKAEQKIEEFCIEDSSRERLIQALQSKVTNMTTLEEKNKKLQTEILQLKEALHSLQESKAESLKEIENLLQNVSELKNAATKLQLEKSDLEEQLRIFKNDYDKLQTDKMSLDGQLVELMDERKSFQEEKTNLEQQLKSLKENEKTIEEKAELLQNLRLTTEKLECAQLQIIENEKTISNAEKEKMQIQQDLELLKESIAKTIQEKEGETEKTKQDNANLYQQLQELREDITKAIKEKEEKQEKMIECQQHNTQLENELTKLEQEKQQQQLAFDKVKQDFESLSKVVEQKQQELNSLGNNYQRAQQQNEDLNTKLNTLEADLNNFKNDKNKKCKENAQLQTELQTVKDSFAKLQEDQKILQEKLQEDKNNLETTFNVLKKAQTGALSTLQEENNQLCKNLQQYEEENKKFKENEETLKQKIESLSQQLHEMRVQVQAQEKLLLEHEDLETALTSTTAANQKLQQEVSQLTSQQENYASKIKDCENLNLQLQIETKEKLMLQTKLSQMKETLQGEHSSLKKQHQELKSSFEELKLKCDSLQATNTHLERLNQQMEQQLNSLKEKLKEFNGVQAELKKLKLQHSELQQRLKEAEGFSQELREDAEKHKQLLQRQLKNYNALKAEMESKEHSLKEKNLKLTACIEDTKKEKLSLEEKLRIITVRNFEQDLQRQAIDATANTSTDSNASHSPRGRRSLERLSAEKAPNLSLEEKRSAMQQKNSTTVERKNRRLSTHDERRRQSYWGVAHDKETMTDPIDTNCNCLELDRKLKDCERNLFIRNSQVTALNMELKNHPLKEENVALKKRLQEEQEKHRIEMKRCKNKLHEQALKAEKAIATAKSAHDAAASAALLTDQQEHPVLAKFVADVETQTTDDFSLSLQKLQNKYDELKGICRYRYNVIKQLEEKEKLSQKENTDGNSMSAHDATQLKMLSIQCESLRNELKTVKEKYEHAKIVLSSRREQIDKLRSEREQTQ